MGFMKYRHKCRPAFHSWFLSRQSSSFDHHRCVTPLYFIPLWNFNCVIDYVMDCVDGLLCRNSPLPGPAYLKMQPLKTGIKMYFYKHHTATLNRKRKVPYDKSGTDHNYKNTGCIYFK